MVINLGTNDANRGSTQEPFQAGVRELITHVRSFYGKDIPIIWVYNMMGSCCFQWTLQVIRDMGGENAGLYTLPVFSDGMAQGGGGHPSLETHIMASEDLVKLIRDKGLLS